jgi:thiamine biosynthesis lipoprotein
MTEEISASIHSLCRCKPLLGTYVEIALSGAVSDDYLVEESEKAFRAIELVQASMSFHDPSSELSAINRRALMEDVTLSNGLFTVLSKADEFNTDSDGFFDPSIAPTLIQSGCLPIPTECRQMLDAGKFGRWKNVELTDREGDKSIRFHQPIILDLGGIAKGFAVDQALKSVDRSLNIVINAGGDIAMNRWQESLVGIQFGVTENRSIKQAVMQNACLASSASYLNNGQSVMVNPKSKKTHDSDHTYSVFASTCMTADALTKLAWFGITNDELMNKHQATLVVTDQHGDTVI